MLTGQITPLFMVSPFSTSGIPDFQRTTIQKLRAKAAHILPEAFDLHPNLLHLLETKFRTEKPRNRETISTEGLATSQGRSIKSAQRNIQSVEETLVLPALVLQIKRNGFPHVSWENPKAFHPRFCYTATSQTGLFFLTNPIFSGWKHSFATHQIFVLVLQRQNFLLIESCSIHLSAWVPWAKIVWTSLRNQMVSFDLRM
jgi:hypothetical protein